MQFSKLFLPATALLICAVVAGACDENLAQPLTPPPATPYLRPVNATCLADALPLGRVRLQPTYQGFHFPLRMVDRPDRGLIYVAEMPGRIKAIDRATGSITTALDLVGKIGTYEEQGLLGLAIHPTKPYAYVTVERDSDATSLKDLPVRAEILRFTMNDGGKTFDPESEELVLRIDRPSSLHYPGTLEFGPDGFLYIGVGDGGQDVLRWPSDRLLGSILRIDVDSEEPYAIPPDNPYVTGGGRPEIFAGGFRNPWRFTFDRGTGEIWAGDVGEAAAEEVNLIERGKNYGWPTMEGTQCFKPKTRCDQSGLTLPVFAYAHSEGSSVTGGYVYRGKSMPDLVGKYVFGDFAIGRVWMLDRSGAAPQAVFLNPGGPKPLVSSFGEDAEGELYAIGWDEGIIYKLVPGEADSRPVFPQLLSQTGCVNPNDAKQFATGLVPYGVNVELWSDGADKRRFLAIPDGMTMHVTDAGHFDLPERGVAVKEFSIDGKRIETRLLRHHPNDEWSGATYEWNDEQTDAVLVETAKDKVLANGQTWPLPSDVQCFVCHKKVAGRTLGTESLQLNRDFTYGPGQSGNQLSTLSDIGYLDRRLDATAPRLPELAGGAPVEDRARAYLHANCAMCHRDGGGTGVLPDFRWGLPRAEIVGCTPAYFPNVPNTKIITPGDPDHSALFLRMSTREDFQMPPLASHKVDPVAVGIMDSWIRSLTTCE